MAIWRISTYFVLFLHLDTVQSVIYHLKGQQVQFDPDITGQPIEILWKHNGNKVVEFNGNEEQVYSSYKGRVTLDWHSATLQISDLCIEDSGIYEYEISMDKFVRHNNYELKVIEKIAKPNITCQTNSSSSVMSAVLLCSVELSQPQSTLMFRWISKGNFQHGPQLTIFLGGELDEEEYTCRVSNPVSYETTTFRAKDCHTDAGSSGGTMALIVFIVFLIVCAVLVVWCYRQKHKACFTKEQTNDLENPTSSEGRVKAIHDWMATEQTLNRIPNLQRTLDEDQKPLVEEKPTASSPQPQKQRDTENDTQPFDSPEEGGLEAAQDSEREEDRGAQSHAGGDLSPAAQPLSPLTQNSPKMAPEDISGEHSKDVSRGCESDSSWQRKHDQPDQSNKELQPSTATEERDSETTDGGKGPNLSSKGTPPSEDNQQEMDKQVPSDEHKGDNKDKDAKGDEEGMDQNNPQSTTTTKPCNRNTDQSSITSEQSGSETTQGGQEPNLLQKEPHESEDNQQEKTSSVVNDKHAAGKC